MEDIYSTSTSSLPIDIPVEDNQTGGDLANGGRRGSQGRIGGGAHGGYQYSRPGTPCDSLAQDHRDARDAKRPNYDNSYDRRSTMTMSRAVSTADISQYECNEDGAIRLHFVINLILLITSLIMIGTG